MLKLDQIGIDKLFYLFIVFLVIIVFYLRLNSEERAQINSKRMKHSVNKEKNNWIKREIKTILNNRVYNNKCEKINLDHEDMLKRTVNFNLYLLCTEKLNTGIYSYYLNNKNIFNKICKKNKLITTSYYRLIAKLRTTVNVYNSIEEQYRDCKNRLENEVKTLASNNIEKYKKFKTEIKNQMREEIIDILKYKKYMSEMQR